jgi:NAD(P)-dependent dehydrogenase (short-subunit alcohol dehydrogenase family)
MSTKWLIDNRSLQAGQTSWNGLVGEPHLQWETKMLLENMTVVITGGSGAIGAATAKIMAREGARVLLGARHLQRLEALRDGIRSTGGRAECFEIDVLDTEDTNIKFADLAERYGEFDAALNATSFMHDQGSTIDELDLATFMRPLETFLPALFNTTKAAVQYMGRSRPGTVLTLTTPAGRAATPGHLGYSAACAAVEAFTRVLAAGSYTKELFAPKASALGLSVDQWLQGGAQSTMLGRLPTLTDVAETAAFLVSGRARAMTGTYVNLTAGMIAD